MKKLEQMSELKKSLAAIGLAILIGALFILLSGESPIEAYDALLKGALGSPRSIANTISKSIPLAFTGLAVALGSRCGMLNYICTLFTSYLVNGPVKAEGSTAQTQALPEGVWFARLIPQTQLTAALFLLIVTAAAMYIFLWKTSIGYQLRAVGANPSAAGTAGIKVKKYLIMSMVLSGGLASLAGITEVFGKYHRYIEGFSPSFGFTGIAVAILGRNHPAGVLLTALLFGIMDMGSLRMSRVTDVSTNMVTVVQSLVILLVAAPELIKWNKKRKRG